MRTVTEEYVSCSDKLQVNGVIYPAGEVVPSAGALKNLPALLKTNRLRIRSVTTYEQEASQDLGQVQARPRATKKRAKKARA